MSNIAHLDLEDLISPTFGIDVFDAKTGTNESVCVLSFRVKTEAAARDLSNFTEREGDWILDSDVSTGEDSSGKFLVFVEIKRTRQLIPHILNLVELIERLAGAMDWKFTLGKFQKRYELTQETLQELVSTTAEEYSNHIKAQREQSMMEFFDGTLYNTVKIDENTLRLEQYFQPHRAHSSLRMTILKENPTTEDINENMNLKIKTPTNSLTHWLDVTMGQNIQVEAAGPNFLLTNSSLNQSLLVKLHV